jgi:hypothetical protein
VGEVGQGHAPTVGKAETITHDGFADIFLGYAPYYRLVG